MTHQHEQDAAGLDQRLKTLAAEAASSPPHRADLSQTRRDGLNRQRRTRVLQSTITGIALVAIAVPLTLAIRDQSGAQVGLGGSESTSGTGNLLRVATYDSALIMRAMVGGELNVEIREEVACTFLDGEPAAWPTGFSVSHEPLAVLDEDGHLVAYAGDPVTGSGGHLPTQVTPPVGHTGPVRDLPVFGGNGLDDPSEGACGLDAGFVAVQEVAPAPTDGIIALPHTDDRPLADGPAEASVTLTDGREALAQLSALDGQGAGPFLRGQVLVTEVQMGVASVTASRWNGETWEAVPSPAQGLVLEYAEPGEPFQVGALRADADGTPKTFEPGWHQLRVLLWPEGDREREIVLYDVALVDDPLEVLDPRLAPFVDALIAADPDLRSRLSIQPAGLVAEVRPGQRADGTIDTGFRASRTLNALDIAESSLVENFPLGEGEATAVVGYGTYVFRCGDAIVAVNPRPADGQDRDAGIRLAQAVGCAPEAVAS